jgi:hypothetical protein
MIISKCSNAGRGERSGRNGNNQKGGIKIVLQEINFSV